MSVLMHMADGLISVPVGIVFFVVSLYFLAVSIKKISESKDDSKVPMMAVMGAFVFVGQMINFTIPGTGSSGHIGGGILLAMVLGQYPAFLSICSVLIIQCLFFGDGGLLALGCNMFNMGVLPIFVAYPLIVKPILNKGVNMKNLLTASMGGVIVGLEAGAFMVVLQTLASRITDLPFGTFIALMLPIHLAIAIGEGLVTAAVTSYVYKENKEMITSALTDQSYSKLSGMKKLISVFACLVVLVGGGLSLYASSNPDGLEWSIGGITGDTEIEASGDVKEALSKVQETTAFLPDYNFKDSDGNIGVSTSGIVGGAITLLALGAVGFVATKKKVNE